MKKLLVLIITSMPFSVLADESVKEKRIAFTAPIVRNLMGKKVGEVADFKLGNESQPLEVVSIHYE